MQHNLADGFDLSVAQEQSPDGSGRTGNYVISISSAFVNFTVGHVQPEDLTCAMVWTREVMLGTIRSFKMPGYQSIMRLESARASKATKS